MSAHTATDTAYAIGKVPAVYRDEAPLLRRCLSDLDLPVGAHVLDVGSSTLEARTIVQPYIDEEIFAPLRERGATITHVDRKEDPGVDVTMDLADPTIDLAHTLGRRYDLVVAFNTLPFAADPARMLHNIVGAVAPSGRLILTAASNYRLMKDPVDNRWRPSPQELLDASRRAGDPRLELVDAHSLRIDDPSEYCAYGRRSSVQIPGTKRFLPVPHQFELIRRHIPALRWRQSIVIARLPREANTPAPHIEDRNPRSSPSRPSSSAPLSSRGADRGISN